MHERVQAPLPAGTSNGGGDLLPLQWLTHATRLEQRKQSTAPITQASTLELFQSAVLQTAVENDMPNRIQSQLTQKVLHASDGLVLLERQSRRIYRLNPELLLPQLTQLVRAERTGAVVRLEHRVISSDGGFLHFRYESAIHAASDGTHS